MAGVYERLTSGKKDAAAQGGGVSFVPEEEGVGVYAKIARENRNQGVYSRIQQERPSDPIYDQWKLERQLREEMERVRQERLQQQKEAAVKAGAPAMAMQPVVTAAQVAVEQARKNQEAAKGYTAEQERAAKSMWKGAQRDIHAAISSGNLEALEGLAKRSAEKRELLDTVRDARTEAANRQAAPERYDNAVTLKGTELQGSYNAEAMAKGAKAAGNPLVDFEGYVEDRRKATGQSPAAMFGVAWGADGKGNRAAEFLSTLSGKEREYIDYLYGTYDRQKAAQLLQAYLTNRANEQPALQPQAVDALQQAENAVQQAEKKTMGRNAGKVPVYIQSHLQDAQRGANINNNAGGVVAGMLSKPAYAVETVAQSVRNLAKGTDLTAPLYSEAALGVADSKAAEDRFLKNFENKKLQWVAGVGLSIANSAANRLLGPLGKFMMGLQAMGGDAYDLAQEGEDATTILVHSALAGIAESAAESISWGRLDEILNGMPPKTFVGLLKTVGAQMATEFGEEAVTEGVNILTDWATRGENSTIAEVAAQAKEDGREHPGWYTAGVMAGQIALAGLAGAFSGGIMGGSALALNAMRNKIGGNAAKANGQAVDLTQKAANAAGNDTAQVKPEELQNAVEPGKQGAEEVPKAAAGIRVEAPIMAVDDEKDAARMNAFIPGSAVVQGEENTKETVADFAQTAADQMPAEENTQSSGESAEKKPPVNWRARNIDAEEEEGYNAGYTEQKGGVDNGTEREKAGALQPRRYETSVRSRIEALWRRRGGENGGVSFDQAARGRGAGGVPRRLYHYTDREFENFEVTGKEIGIHAGTLAQAEKRWADKGVGGGRVVEVEYNINNPLFVKDVFDAPEKSGEYPWLIVTNSDLSENEKQLLAQKGARLSYLVNQRKSAQGQEKENLLNGQINTKYNETMRTLNLEIAREMERLAAKVEEQGGDTDSMEALIKEENAEFVEALEALGYDGFTYANEVEGDELSFAVFRPEQIHQTNKRYAVPAEDGSGMVIQTPEEPARPANKRSAESRARDAARELHAGKDGAAKILQTIQQMDAANMTPEMRRVVAQNVAKELVKEGPYISKEFWESFAPLREYLKTTQMHIDDQTLGEIKAMGLSVTKFNERYGTRLTTQNKPGMRSLDANLAQWAPMTNGMVQADEGNAFEALVHTLDTMRQGKAGELDKRGMESAIDGAAEVLLKYADETMEPDELEALDKKDGKKTAPQSSTSQVKPQGTGWEKFEDNRIAQAMYHKPEGAVANMGNAERVRHAEEEIKKAEDRLKDLKENAEKGEIKMAEAVAEGSMTLRQVSEDFSREKVALMAEQLRLIKQWEEQGLVGQKKRMHSEQFEAAEKLLEGADDAIFEHDTEGAKKLISKRKGELFRMLSSTSERVMRQVFDKKTAQRAIEEYIRPAERNEAAKIMAISRLFDGARELKLNRYESTMVQLVGEGLVPAWSKAGTNPLWNNGQALVESLPEYARANPEIKKLAENLGRIDPGKILKAVEWYRKTYDDFHALVNDFRLAHGMPEIGNIEQYFPHFSQDMDGDMLNQTLKAFGIEQMSNLPASIAGMTQGFRPFSRWVGSFQKRTGPQTVFDAEQGFQMYANAVMDMLYHTDDIMRIRHLETMIRRRSKEAGETGKRPGAKERLEAMKQTMENPEQLKKLEEDMELGERDGTGKDISGEYSGFVQWLREYGNKLAGKGDTYRLVEPVAGRRAANVINKLLGNYGTAQIVGNLRSAIANTAVLPKMLALLGTQKGSALKPEIYIGQALGKMARGEMASLYGKSEFMTSKQGVEPLVKTKKDKAADVLMKFFNVVEDAMSKLAFTAGYVQAEDQLKDSTLNAKELEREAIQRANDFAANIMARRDKAGSALLGRSREPSLRLVSMFQTEISNEWQTIRQDLPREYEELEQQIGKKKAQATYAAALARYVVYSHVLGFAAEAVFGINPFNDVWAWIADFARNIWEEPEEEDEKGKLNLGAVTDLAGEVAGSVPYLSIIAALAGYTNDRLPLFNAKEFVEDLGSIATAERFSGRVEGVANVAGSVGQLLGVPGAGQGVKTVKGAAALLDQGKRSQKTGQLQDVWQWDGGKGVWDAARALAFGPSAMKGMREYYDTGKAELTKKQTEAYDAKVKAGVSKGEALEYAKDIMPALTSSQLEAYDAAIGAGIHKDTALSYVKWSKGVTAKKDKDGETIPNSKRIQYLQQANEFESLTGEQRAILYQGALPSDQAKEFEEMTQKVDRLGVDMDTWMEFLERYYQIRGSGKKQRVRELMEDLELPPTTAQILGDIIGYDIR